MNVDKEPRTASSRPTDNFSRRTIYTNVVVLSASFFLLFSAFQAVTSLQTSINSQQGLGSTSLSVIYACLILSCLLLPELVIGLLTIKWTLVACICLYTTYVLANVAPSWYSLMPTSVFVGLAAGPLWTAECTYITEMGRRLDGLISPANAQARQSLLGGSPISKEAPASITSDAKSTTTAVSFLFGIFYCFFQSGGILGNLISSLTLQQAGSSAFSFSLEPAQVYASRAPVCGGNYCPSTVITPSNLTKNGSTDDDGRFRPTASKIYLLCSIYAGMSLCAAIFIALFFRNYTNSTIGTGKIASTAAGGSKVRSDSKSSGEMSDTAENSAEGDEVRGSNCCGRRIDFSRINVWAMCFATVRQMRDTRQLLLIPLSIYSGLQQGFMAADYTKSYVSCIYGVKFIGFTMIAYGLVNATISPISGYLNKKVPRWVLFATAATIHLSLFPILAFHTVGFTQSLTLLFGIAGLWGAFDGIWQPQINGLYGSLFHDNPEPAFSNHRLWEALGFILSFSYHDFLCIRIKLLIMLIMLILSTCTYATVEYLQKSRVGKGSSTISKEEYISREGSPVPTSFDPYTKLSKNMADFEKTKVH